VWLQALTAIDPATDYETMSSSSRITSRQNQRVKDAVRLREGRDRLRQGRFLIDGIREIQRAVAVNVRCIEAFVCDELCESTDAKNVVKELESSGAEMLSVAPDVFAKLAFGDRQEGIVVVAQTPSRTLADLHLPDEPLVAVLEGIEKPGNLGAILRSADAAGLDGVIIADGRTDLFNPNTIRASLGTVFRTNVCETTSAAAATWLRQHKIRAVAARPDASALYTQIDLRGGVAIVLGSEASGLTAAWSGADVVAARLPMHGLADSLNVSTTAAVLFYEALRQRAAGKR
jgi:TrmH family RNA methyltransferase